MPRQKAAALALQYHVAFQALRIRRGSAHGLAVLHYEPKRDSAAETVRCELTDGFLSSVFQTGALNRSATFPGWSG